MPDLRIASTPLFTSVSVTAERWVDLEEVPVAQLPLWLSQARAQVRVLSSVSHQDNIHVEGLRTHAGHLSLWRNNYRAKVAFPMYGLRHSSLEKA